MYTREDVCGAPRDRTIRVRGTVVFSRTLLAAIPRPGRDSGTTTVDRRTVAVRWHFGGNLRGVKEHDDQCTAVTGRGPFGKDGLGGVWRAPAVADFRTALPCTTIEG